MVWVRVLLLLRGRRVGSVGRCRVKIGLIGVELRVRKGGGCVEALCEDVNGLKGWRWRGFDVEGELKSSKT